MQRPQNVPQSQLMAQAMDNWTDVWRRVIPPQQRPTVPYAVSPPPSAGEGYASALPRLMQWLRSQNVI